MMNRESNGLITPALNREFIQHTATSQKCILTTALNVGHACCGLKCVQAICCALWPRVFRYGLTWAVRRSPTHHGEVGISENGCGRTAALPRSDMIVCHRAFSLAAWPMSKSGTPTRLLPILLCGRLFPGIQDAPSQRVTKSTSHTVKKGILQSQRGEALSIA
jgi:hypothetical protein